MPLNALANQHSRVLDALTRDARSLGQTEKELQTATGKRKGFLERQQSILWGRVNEALQGKNVQLRHLPEDTIRTALTNARLEGAGQEPVASLRY